MSDLCVVTLSLLLSALHLQLQISEGVTFSPDCDRLMWVPNVYRDIVFILEAHTSVSCRHWLFRIFPLAPDYRSLKREISSYFAPVIMEGAMIGGVSIQR